MAVVFGGRSELTFEFGTAGGPSAAGSGYSGQYDAAFKQGDGSTALACDINPVGKILLGFGADFATGFRIRLTARGKCTAAQLANGVRIAVGAGGRGGSSAVFNNLFASGAAGVAAGLLAPFGDNSVAGRFQGYFALEFTDEGGDTWMAE